MSNKEVHCYECGEPFILNRPDRQFCSGRCRSQNFRRVQQEKMNLLERLFDRLPRSAKHCEIGSICLK
jgi:predicted nucleic acid-binding Zn ribbon protein